MRAMPVVSDDAQVLRACLAHTAARVPRSKRHSYRRGRSSLNWLIPSDYLAVAMSEPGLQRACERCTRSSCCHPAGFRPPPPDRPCCTHLSLLEWKAMNGKSARAISRCTLSQARRNSSPLCTRVPSWKQAGSASHTCSGKPWLAAGEVAGQPAGRPHGVEAAPTVTSLPSLVHGYAVSGLDQPQNWQASGTHITQLVDVQTSVQLLQLTIPAPAPGPEAQGTYSADDACYSMLPGS